MSTLSNVYDFYVTKQMYFKKNVFFSLNLIVVSLHFITFFVAKKRTLNMMTSFVDENDH